jgi:hypothetical protein
MFWGLGPIPKLHSLSTSMLIKLCLKLANGGNVHASTLQRALEAAQISVRSDILSVGYVLHWFKAAKSARKELQKDHKIIRETYLTQLAEALVKLQKNLPPHTERFQAKVAKAVKRLIRKEKKRWE